MVLHQRATINPDTTTAEITASSSQHRQHLTTTAAAIPAHSNSRTTRDRTLATTTMLRLIRLLLPHPHPRQLQRQLQLRLQLHKTSIPLLLGRRCLVLHVLESTNHRQSRSSKLLPVRSLIRLQVATWPKRSTTARASPLVQQQQQLPFLQAELAVC